MSTSGTFEDVFYLYEYNYNNKQIDINKEKIVYPLKIGCDGNACKLNKKCYIKQGDDCPICYDKIMTKSTAFITPCGHQYHKSCLFQYMKNKWNTMGYTALISCPICRRKVEHPHFVRRYKSSYFSTNKLNVPLDKLEDFWLSFEYSLPAYCSNGYDHYLGIMRECNCCKSFREKGEYIYEF